MLDFGGNRVKRAKALYREGNLTELGLMPSLPAPTNLPPEALADAMARIVAESVAQAGVLEQSYLALSLAAYIRDNQPLSAQGGTYVGLSELGTNAGDLLAQRVSTLTGRPLHTRPRRHGGTGPSRFTQLRCTTDGNCARHRLPCAPKPPTSIRTAEHSTPVGTQDLASLRDQDGNQTPNCGRQKVG